MGGFSGGFSGVFRGFCSISVVRLEIVKKPNVYRGFWCTERALISSQIVSKGGRMGGRGGEGVEGLRNDLNGLCRSVGVI